MRFVAAIKQRRAWIVVGLLAFALASWSGCADAGVTVTLSSWPAGASEVRVVPSLDGVAGSEIVLDRSQLVFVVRVPQGRGGVLSLAARGLDAGSCKVATGSLEQALPSGIRPYVDAALSLSTLPTPLCPLNITVQGSGSAKATWTGDGGAPQRLDCVEGAMCQVELPLQPGSPVAVTISARETLRREYPSIAGGCLGLHDCQLRMDRAQTVSVRMVPRQCTDAGFCVYNPLPYAVNWAGIWGAAENDIWAVGNFVGGGGALGHFDGQSWHVDPPSSKLPGFTAIWGSAANDVWAVGSAGTVYHFDGSKWGPINSTSNSLLRGVWGSSSQDVWVVGDVGTIRRWNGTAFGTVASSGASNTGANNAVWGSGPNDVWVVGDVGWAWHFDGASGTKVNVAATSLPINSVWGSASNDVWAAAGTGGVGAVLRWDGTSWTQVRVLSGTEPTYTEVFGLPGGIMWLAGNGGTLVQGRSGTWVTQTVAAKDTLRSVWGNRSDNIWIVGDAGNILHYDGRTTRSYSEGLSNYWLSHWGTGSDDIWLGGRSGVVAHWDGIKHTQVAQLSVNSNINALTGTGSQDVYAFGTAAVISHFDGNSWTSQTAPVGASEILAAWASGPTDVWAGAVKTTGAGMLLRRTTGPAWTEVTTVSPFADAGIGGVHGSSATDIWFCNRNGNVASWNGSALTANSNNIPGMPGQSVVSMWTLPTGEAWAVGGTGGVYSRTGRTATWSISAPATNTYFYTVFGSSKSDVWVGDGAGFAGHWDGSAWSRFLVQQNSTLFGFFVAAPGDLWLAADGVGGSIGAIYRYVP